MWNGYLHCSWETKRNFIESCEGGKERLSMFFRKAEGGLLHMANEQLDSIILFVCVVLTA